MPPIDPGLTLAEFDYFLPPDLIAQTPPVERDGGRLLVIDRGTSQLVDASVIDLPNVLQAGDLLIINNTRVLPARLHGKRHTGGAMELLLLSRRESGIWEGLARPSRVCKPGATFDLISNDGDRLVPVTVLENLREGRVVVQFDAELEADLEAFGQTPLPPYIKSSVEDPERYQTVFSTVPGSAAAPTAGLHLSERLLTDLTAKGIRRAEVTLQIGLDTFRPVTAERVVDHHMHAEWCSVPASTAAAIAATKAAGGRVVAIGTTSARTLESWAAAGSPETDWSDWTSIFITPGYQWQVVDAMLTNFHLPKSTLLMMVTSFAGFDLARLSYLHAIAARYRFFSFGDAMLIV